VNDAYHKELLGIIQAGIDEHPRSRQVLPGPSDIGGCERKLAFKMAYGDSLGQEQGGWAAHVGTTLHSWYDYWWSKNAKAQAAGHLMPNGEQRYLSDLKLHQIVPEVAGGTLDLYDRLQECVIDFKCPGPSSMKKVTAGQVARGYFIQAQVYGLGLKLMGYKVSQTAILYTPVGNDDLHGNSRLKMWDFDEQVAWDALKNVSRISNMLTAAPTRRVLDVLPTFSDFCQGCPAFLGNGDRRAMCPGATKESRSVDISSNPFAR
jgi:hypothetical protein